MQDNHYAPPKADVEGALTEAATAPPLWNPNAAASWSLLFTPIFGTWLHWRNWVALGEAERAGTARTWFIASVVLVVVSILISAGSGQRGSGVRILNFAVLIGWYYAGAKPQVKYVAERFGDTYARQGWARPILSAIGAIVAAIVVVTVLVVLRLV